MGDFKVLGREFDHWLLEIKKSLFIKTDRPSLQCLLPGNVSILVLRCPLYNFDSFYLMLFDTLFINLADC